MEQASPEVAAVQQPTKKRVALFLDGTWNVVENNTNVWRLYSLCAPRESSSQAQDPQKPREQVRYYTKGVGTTYGEKVRGGLFGVGINTVIIAAYEWLVAHYDPGDEIFIFGFSRGAYAARSLAGLIAKYGVLRPGSPIGIGELFARYRKGAAERTIYQLTEARRTETLGEPTTLERWMLTYSVLAAVRMVGVWDTVGALHGSYGFLETGLRQTIEHGYHALAIDEHRPTFAPTLWTRNIHFDQPASIVKPRDIAHVEQRWFVGAHANVGGGYSSDLLAQPSLRWLMSKASALGLSFREELKDEDGLYAAPVNDSFREMAGGAYYIARLGRPYLRPIGAADVMTPAMTTETINETIDRSVFERWRSNPSYRPRNLIAWARDHAIDPASLSSSVFAKAPGTSVPDGAASQLA